MARSPHVRVKNGVETTALEPRGKRRGSAGATALARRSDGGERLLFAMLLRASRKAAEKQGRPMPEHVPSVAALDSRIDRALGQLRQTPEGRAVIARETAVAANCGHAIGYAVRAAPDLLDAVLAGCSRYGALASEHGLTGTATRTHALRAALFGVLSDVLVGRAFEFGPQIMKATSASPADAAGKTSTVSIGAFDSNVKLAGVCAQNARHELMLALQLQREADDAGKGRTARPSQDPEVAARVAAREVEIKERAAAWAAKLAAAPQPADELDDQDQGNDQDAGHPHVGPTLTPPTLEALQRAARPTQPGYRPVPSEPVSAPRAPVLAWLPVELHPWAGRFANLEQHAPIQRVSGACGIVGSLQASGALGREEGRVVAAVQSWRARFMATGVLPLNEGSES